jgi:fatty acid desaturase
MSASKPDKPPAEVIKSLTRRSDAKGLVQLSAHLALLLLAGLGLRESAGGPLFLPALLFYGTLLTFLFAPLHETIHFTAFRTRWLNNLVAAPIGFLLLIPFQYFRAYHYAHHRDTQNPGRDPELIGRQPLSGGAYWWHVSGLPFWWNNLATIYRHARGRVAEPYIEPAKHAAIVLEARLHLLGYAVLLLAGFASNSGFLWWYWVLPALLAQPLLRFFLLAEHSGCDFSDNMLENSRTTYTAPWVNFLCWNMSYHAEHHYLASVPFHALPALHAYTGQRVKFTGDGYYRVNREIAARS